MSKCNCILDDISHVRITRLITEIDQMDKSKINMYQFEVYKLDGSQYKVLKSYKEFNNIEKSFQRKTLKLCIPEHVPLHRSYNGSWKSFQSLKSGTPSLSKLKEFEVYCNSLLTLEDLNVQKMGRKLFSDCTKCNDEVWSMMNVDQTNSSRKMKLSRCDTMQISDPISLPIYVVNKSYDAKDDIKMITLEEGQEVKVHNKEQTGWWFVTSDGGKSGWFPSCCLSPLCYEDCDDEIILNPPEKYEAVADYQACSEEEMSFKKGDIIKVKQKSFDGWWTVVDVTGQGQTVELLAPAIYLKPPFGLCGFRRFKHLLLGKKSILSGLMLMSGEVLQFSGTIPTDNQKDPSDISSQTLPTDGRATVD